MKKTKSSKKIVLKITMSMTITNYQVLVESLKKRDDIVQKLFDRQDVRLARHRKYLDNHQEDIKQIVKDQVCMVNRMTVN